MSHPTLRVTLTLAVLFAVLPVSQANPSGSAPDLTLYGDLRVRYEWDWDSQNAAGVARLDRDRARGRIRAGFTYKLAPAWTVGARLRTGNPLSQQSPHLTFHQNDGIVDDFKLQPDRYFIQYKEGAFTAWGGRNTAPFWQQSEVWWDEDVTPTGTALSYDHRLTRGTLTATGAILGLPDGMRRLNGTLAGVQLKYVRPVKPSQFTLAGGLYQFNGRDGAQNLRNRNGARDYLIGVLSGQWTMPVVPARPLTLGVDLIRNFTSYRSADVAPFAASQKEEKSGCLFSVLFGQLKNPCDWQAGYFYAHVETLAVNASYAPDDWARFGSATQADVTDFKGHEFRAAVVLCKNVNLTARLFLVDALASIQNGKRFRLDLNWKF